MGGVDPADQLRAFFRAIYNTYLKALRNSGWLLIYRFYFPRTKLSDFQLDISKALIEEGKQECAATKIAIAIGGLEKHTHRLMYFHKMMEIRGNARDWG
jgi:hypothetical protein